MKFLGYPKNSIESWAIYYIDKGNSFDTVLAALTGVGDNNFCRDDEDPAFDLKEAEERLNQMIGQKVLACGQMHGWERWLVVRKWMPRTAARIDKQNEPPIPCSECGEEAVYDSPALLCGMLARLVPL